MDPEAAESGGLFPPSKLPSWGSVQVLTIWHQADEAWMIRGGGTSLASDLNPPHKRRELVVISALIEHPVEGLLLFEYACPMHFRWS